MIKSDIRHGYRTLKVMNQPGVLVTHEGQKVILTVRNPHVVPEDTAHVTSLVLRPMGLKAIPPWASSIPLLNHLQVNDNPLAVITDIPSRLTNLEAKNCKLRDVIGNLPEFLTHLDVSCNHISDPAVFERLPATLRVLTMQDNRISLLPKRFPLRILTRLVLDFNSLTSLPNGLPNTIHELSVSGNMLSELPERLPLNLRILRAESNQIAEIDLKVLAKCEALSYLDLSGNCIRTLEAGFLPGKLEVLKLRNNGLRLSETLILPSSLRVLDLSNNNLNDIGFLKFSGGALPPLRLSPDRIPYHSNETRNTIARLRRGFQQPPEESSEGLTVILSNNPILTYIAAGILPRNLINLEIDCCGLTELPADLRHTCLEYLSAEMNHLTSFRLDDLPSSLISLYLTRNQIGRIVERNPYASWHRLINLKNVSLRQNLLESVPRSWMIEMTQLRSLDLSENALKDFPQALPPNLTDLILESNLLRDMGHDPLPANLRRLCLQGNLISSITGPALLSTTGNLTTLLLSDNLIRYVSPQVRAHLETIFPDEEDHEWGGIRRHRIFDNFPIETVYRDPQIVHRHEVQESIRESIRKLMRDRVLESSLKLDVVAKQLVGTKIAHPAVKNILIYAGLLAEDCAYTSRNADLLPLILPLENRLVVGEQISLGDQTVGFDEILRMTWSLVERHPERATIVDNLEKELNQEITPCITGLVDSLVGCLAVFDERIEIRISLADQLAAVIEATGRTLEKQGRYTIEEHKRAATAEMLERGIALTQIQTWVAEIA